MAVKVWGFHNGNDGVSFYRVWQPLKWMEKQGAEIGRFEDADRWEEKPLGEIEGACDVAQALFFGYSPNAKASLYMGGIKRMGKPVVVDIDDDVINLPPWHQHKEIYESGRAVSNTVRLADGETGKCRDILGGAVVEKGGHNYRVFPNADPLENVKREIQIADRVIASTEEIKSLYRPYNKQIEVIPNGIDFDLWGDNGKVDDGYIRMGLIGSVPHRGDWEDMSSTIKDVLADNKRVKLVVNGFTTENISLPDLEKLEAEGRLVVVGGRTLTIPMCFADLVGSDQFEVVSPSKIQDWPSTLAGYGLDIGLAPLLDIPFNRAKSNLKFLEYGALKVAGVYQYLSPYRCVKQGVTGYTAKRDQFRGRIQELVDSKSLRVSMGEAGHREVRERFSMEKIGHKYMDLFKGLVNKLEAVA